MSITRLILVMVLVSSTNALVMSARSSTKAVNWGKILGFSRIHSLLNVDKESNRKFRRTVFAKGDWEKHRSNSRYLKDFLSMPFSLVLRGLTLQALAVMGWSIILVAYNMMVEKFTQNMTRMYLPLLSIPALPVSLMSSSLGLLLVFRTNKSYSRWDKARVTWATVSSKSFDLMRQSIIFMPDKTLKLQLVRRIIAYSKTLKWYLGHQGNDKLLYDDLTDVLTAQELVNLIKSKNRLQHNLMRIAETVAKANLVPNVQSHMDRTVSDLSDSASVCDRIYTSPIPLSYTRHTARFLLLWLLTVPMAMYHEFRNFRSMYHPLLYIPLITFLHSIFLFGIEELGVQIEEPFSILPLAHICNNIKNMGVELLEEQGLELALPPDENKLTSPSSSSSSSSSDTSNDTLFNTDDVNKDTAYLMTNSTAPSIKDFYTQLSSSSSSSSSSTAALTSSVLATDAYIQENNQYYMF